MATEGVWLRNPKTGAVNLVVHPETIARCLSEGHTIVPDPRLPALPALAAARAEDAVASSEVGAVAAADEAVVEVVTLRNNAARASFGVAPVIAAHNGTTPAASNRPVRSVRSVRRPVPASDSNGKQPGKGV